MGSMKHFFKLVTGSNKCLYRTADGFRMRVYKEGGDPSSLYHVYIYVSVCVSELWEVSWQRTWAGQSSLDLSELTGTMKTSGVFLLLSLAIFCFFSGEFFFFFLKVKIQYLHWTGNNKCICTPYFKILIILIQKINSERLS